MAGGAIAQELLAGCGIAVAAATVELGGIPASGRDFAGAQERPFFAADEASAAAWEARVREVKGQGDTLGGIVEVRATGVPAGLGEPTPCPWSSKPSAPTTCRATPRCACASPASTC